LGFGEDIEMAEEKRSRRLGKQRVTDLQQGDFPKWRYPNSWLVYFMENPMENG